MTRPLPARLVLLGAAAVLAAFMVFALVVAEHRDGDRRAPAIGTTLGELGSDRATVAPVEGLRAVPVSAPR